MCRRNGAVAVGWVGLAMLGCSAAEPTLVAVDGEEGVLFVDDMGNVRIPGPFEAAGVFREGLAPVKRDGLWGFVDRTGREVVSPTHDAVGPLCEGRAAFEREGLWGYLDAFGAVAVAPHFDEAGCFGLGLAPVRVGERWGFVDASGQLAIAPVYLSVARDRHGRAFGPDGLAGVGVERTIGARFNFVDVKGDLLRTDSDEWLKGGIFSDGYAPVMLPGGGNVYVDKRGRAMSEPGPNLLLPLEGGLGRSCEVVSDGDSLSDCRLVDPTQTPAFAQSYSAVGTLSEGLVAVETSVGWSYLDRMGGVRIAGPFASAEAFEGGVARVGFRSGSTTVLGLIDQQGTRLWPPELAPVEHAVPEEGAAWTVEVLSGTYDGAGSAHIVRESLVPALRQLAEQCITSAPLEGEDRVRFRFRLQRGAVVPRSVVVTAAPGIEECLKSGFERPTSAAPLFEGAIDIQFRIVLAPASVASD